jgi:hypothetical protein
MNMKASPLLSTFDRGIHPSYERRVRGASQPTFLWGSAGIQNNIIFDKAPILHIRNELFGAAVTFGTTASGGVQTEVGTLQPGECVSIPLQAAAQQGVPQGITGVYATCPTESVITCLIKE